MGGQRSHLIHFLEGADGHVGAVHQLQVSGKGIALLLGVGGDAVDIGLQLLLHVVIEGSAFGLGLLAEQIALGQILLGGVLQEGVPGHVLLGGDAQQHLGHGVQILALHGAAAVQTHIAGIAGVSDVVQGVIVKVIHLGGGEVLAVYCHGGGAPLENAGVVQQHHGGHDDKQDGYAAVDQLVLFPLGSFLLLPLYARIDMTLSSQLLAVFLFSGCTHLFFSPLK